MIKFKAFIKEEVETIKLNSLEETAEIIKKNCSQTHKLFVEEDLCLYRGVNLSDFMNILSYLEEFKNYSSAFFISEPKTDRKPKDTPEHIHDSLLDVFNKLGFKTNRGNSIFCTGNMDATKEYGSLFIIFPYDGFEFLWSPIIKDLYSDLIVTNNTKSHVIQKLYPFWEKLKKLYFKYPIDYEDMKYYFQLFISYQDLHTIPLTDKLNLQNYIDENNISKKELYKIDEKLFQTKCRYTDENIKKAILSKNEIMISGAKYVAVHMGDDYYTKKIDLKYLLK